MTNTMYPRAIHYLASQSSIASESIDLICYLWSKDGITVLHDIDKARKGADYVEIADNTETTYKDIEENL